MCLKTTKWFIIYLYLTLIRFEVWVNAIVRYFNMSRENSFQKNCYHNNIEWQKYFAYSYSRLVITAQTRQLQHPFTSTTNKRGNKLTFNARNQFVRQCRDWSTHSPRHNTHNCRNSKLHKDRLVDARAHHRLHPRPATKKPRSGVIIVIA